MKKRILSLLLTACMLLGMLPGVALATETTAAPTPVTNATELAELANQSGSYVLKNDITLTGNWTPIAGFTGTFDGNGYIISGLNVTTASVIDYRACAGLFGEISGTQSTPASIRNLVVRGTVAVTTDESRLFAGGITGSVGDNASVENCAFLGNITAQSTFSNSVAAMIFAGGVAGEISGYSSSSILSNCYASGNVTATVAAPATKTNRAYAGGVVGMVGDEGATGKSEYCMGLSSATVQAGYAGAMTTANTAVVDGSANHSIFAAQSLVHFFSRDTGSGIYTGEDDETLLTSLNTNKGTNLEWANDTVRNDGYPVPVPALATAENWQDGISATTTTWDSGGNITSAAELAQFAYNVNYGKTYSGKTIKLTADIDLAGKQWTPIGNSSYFFSGTFDGMGHTIANLTITGTADQQGLFGCAQPLNIRNLGVVNCAVTGGDAVGAIVGELKSGNLYNCYSTGAVTGGSNLAGVGGIVGINSNTGGNIKNCYSTATVGISAGVSSSYIGGIAGETRPQVAGYYLTGSAAAGVGGSGVNTEKIRAFTGDTLASEIAVYSLGENTKPATTSLLQALNNGVDNYLYFTWVEDTGNANGGYPVFGPKYEPPHTHGVDGGSGSQTYTAWTSQTALPTDAGSYYLKEDVTLSANWGLGSKTINLCLNGHTINTNGYALLIFTNDSGAPELNLCDCQTDGTITGGTKDNGEGAAVQIEYGKDSSPTVNMYGGKITGSDTGVALATYGFTSDKPVFNMYGGTITGNTTGIKYGSGTVNLDGAVALKGNTGADIKYFTSIIPITLGANFSTATPIGINAGNQTNGEPLTGALTKAFGSDVSSNFTYVGEHPLLIIANGADNAVQLKFRESWTDEGSYDAALYATDAGDWQIADAADLAAFAKKLNDEEATFDGATVTLTGDIDLTGKLWNPIKNFEGTFDGGGHTISGMEAAAYSTRSEVYSGLFATLSDATAGVRNLAVSGTSTALSTLRTAYAGGIVAAMFGKSADTPAFLQNCVSNVVVTATSPGKAYAGGIAGMHTNSRMINCVNNGAVTANAGSAAEPDSYTAYAGGLAGFSIIFADEPGCINNSYNTGAVTATGIAQGDTSSAYAGGIVGGLDSDNLRNCYNVGTVSATAGTAVSGGIVGTNDSGVITSCYYLGSSETDSEDGTTFKTSDAMKAADFVTALNGWVTANTANFSDAMHWKQEQGQNSGYPILAAPPVTDPEAEWTPTSGTKATGTFAAALAAMETTGGSIKLLKNITLTETAQFISSITLDLNGHNITQTTKTLPVLTVGTGGAVVLCDSTASTTNNVYTAGTITGGLIGVSIVGGSFELRSGKISGNGADTGSDNSGGVLVGEGNNIFTMSGGEISGNIGDYGAGVNVDGSFENRGGSFTMNGGVIKNNAARRGGGGINVGNDTTFTMNDGTIDHNSATAGNGGGGISSGNGTVVLKNGTVTGNTAGAGNSGATGGIYCYNGAGLTLSGDVIVTGNTFDGKAADITIAKRSNVAIILTSQMKNATTTAIQLRSGEAGDTLVKSDGTYTITTSDLAKFTSADTDFTFALDGAGTSTVIKLASASVADPEAEWTPTNGVKASGTFAQALTAMGASGGSIKLLSDVATADSTILPAKTVSLDLNGKTWSSGSEVRVDTGSTLNLSGTGGGKISFTADLLTVQPGGTLNLSGGTIESGHSVGYSALSNSGTVVMSGGKIVRSGHNIAAVNNEGTFTITGGEITNDTGDGINNDETLTMSGGIITAKKYGIKNRKTLTMTGGSITADGDGVYNSSMSKSATITGGTIKSLKEYGINNWSNAKLYLGGTASVTATVKSAVYNGTTLYLSGTPTLTKGSNNNTYQIYDDMNGEIVANNGKADNDLAYYAGGTLDIFFPGSIRTGTVLVSGIENADQAKKFGITISTDTLTPTYDDATKKITAKGKEYTITYKDRAKADDGAPFTGTHGANYPTSYTAGVTTTLVVPTKANYTFDGWYRNPWGSTDEAVTELSSSASGNKTFYAKWIPNNITAKTATPDLENTIAAASSGGYAGFYLKVGAEYQEQVEYKLYTAATGNAVPADITAVDYFGEEIELYPVTVSTDYWLSATEDGKLESDRVKISVRPRYSGLDTEGYLTITTPQELADYLNYCEPGSAVVNGTTVTQSKDVHSLYTIYFAGSFEGVWDLGGKAVRPSGNTAIYLFAPDEDYPEYSHAENVKLTVKNGTIFGDESAFSIEAGTVTLESVALSAYQFPIDCYNGTLTMTDVTATVTAIEGAEDELGTQSAALYTTPLANITIHSGKLVNEYEGGKTYYSRPNRQTLGKKLSACIPATSISVPADSVSFVDEGVTYELCTETVTVTKNGGQPVPTYTLTYNGNGSTSGAVPTDSNEYRTGTSATVLGNIGTLTKTGHIFAGWNTKSDGSGTDYAAGASLTITGNTTLYAKWTPVFDVGGSVTDDTNVAVANATVKLMLGKDQIGTDKNTDAQGKFTFTEVPTGVYNLVITHGIQIVTRIISVTANTTVDTVKLPKGTTNSVVEVKDDTPVVVGGLDEQFTPEEKTFAETANNSVTIKLTVEKKAEHSAANADEIKLAVPDTKKLDAYLDLSVLKTTVTNNIPDGGEVMAQTLTLLEIRVPLTADQLGKTGYAVYRYHVDKVDTLTNTHNADGEYIEVVAGMLILHVKKFSTYAIAFDKTVAPTPPTGGSDVTTYAITAASGEGGVISPKGTVYVNRNGSKTFTITPNEGYEIADVLADGVSVGRASTYTFEKVTAKHTIEASFRRTVKNPFTDVTEDDWFYSAVTDLYEKGLMTGTAADSFSPLMNTDRATIVTILWRLEGMPSAVESSAFHDVPADAWYAEAVAWAAEKEIVKGYDTGKFGPADPITREQLAAILWRYAGSPAVLDYEGTGRFTDTEAISHWAAKAVTWAISEGLLTGKGDGILDPTGHAVRAEAAAMLARFLKSSDD